ncbi:MAG TPA: site-2 protease family protein [Clostridia bacterium]|nr:site-2 protease family protein [Clostridia bacterium]
MRNWSISAGRIFGIDLRIHLTFAFLLLFVWVTESATSGARGAARGLALVAIVFGSVVLHELGHAIVALSSGVGVRSIVLLPIGGVTVMDDESLRKPNPRRDIRIAAAGPVVNLLIAAFVGSAILLFSEVDLLARPFVHSGNLPRSLFWANLFLGAFNLLPAYPMDGGRVLRAWFAERMDYLRATRRAVTVGQVFAMAFILVGAVANTWLMLIGVFLFFGAQLEDRSVVFQSVLETVRMEDVMLTDFRTLSPADTLEDALHKAVHSLQDDFPVVRGSDLVGVISRQGIMEALRSDGNSYVQGAMNRVFQVANRSETLASVFKKVGQKGLSLVPVVDEDHLVGIVTLQNLMHSMALLAETRKLRREIVEG